MPPESAPTRPISSTAVAQQFSRRGDLQSAQFLYAEIAARMMGRLKYIRLDPTDILDAGCATGTALPLLRARFERSHYTGLDHAAPLLALAQQHHGLGKFRSLMSKLTRSTSGTTQFVQADLARTMLPPESMDLVWSNLALHWHPRPHDVLAEWQRILKVQALVMFSCFGPATLRELRDAVATAGLQTQTPAFVDMHDFGDLLVEKGFSDPVMDQEILTLTFETPERVLEDVRALGGNPSTGRRAGLVGRAWRDRLLAALEAQRGADGLIRMTIEVAYGHAWRAGARRSSPTETRLSVESIGGRRSKS